MSDKNKYNETMLLPKTEFGMRGKLPTEEPKMLEYWEKIGLWEKLREKGIIARSVWRPLHQLSIFKKCPKDNLANSNKFFQEAISFPNGPKI